MTKYKDLYDKEKSKNKFLNEEKQQKINRINDLSLNINNLNTKIDDLNTKNKKDNKQLNVLNEEIKQLKIKSEKKVNELNEKNISLKNEFKNKESIIQSEKNKLEVKAKKTQIENLKLMEENKELKEQNMTLQNFGIRYKTDHEEGDYDIILCVDSIKNLANVSLVRFGEEMVEQLLDIFDVIEKFSFYSVIALIVVTVFLIINTIKLTIFSRKREISIMRLVGASNLSIKIPFVSEGIILGIIGSIIPMILVFIGYKKFYEHFGGKLFTQIINLAKPNNVIYVTSLLILATLEPIFNLSISTNKFLSVS